jgi:hypothetical protein
MPANAPRPGNPKDLPKEQAAVAFWLSKKYRVAPEPLSVLVAEAYDIGTRTKLDPTLILAIMAIESSFNPFAQSAVGAQGLMQVMTRVHTDKYQNFGGHFAAFDPVSNLRVGVKVLQECISTRRFGRRGLRYYVGAANLPDDGGYTAKVMAEHSACARSPMVGLCHSHEPVMLRPLLRPPRPQPLAQCWRTPLGRSRPQGGVARFCGEASCHPALAQFQKNGPKRPADQSAATRQAPVSYTTGVRDWR